MSFLEIIVISVALAMDCFAVSVACGITSPKIPLKSAAIAGLFFGGFQAMMPVIGWTLGELAYEQIEHYDHWIAFFLLAGVGIKMMDEAIRKKDEEDRDCFLCPINYKMLAILAVATSIDALAVGVSISFMNLSIIKPALTIGLTSFCLTIAGLKFGVKIGKSFGNKIEFVGGLVIIGIGLRILIAG